MILIVDIGGCWLACCDGMHFRVHLRGTLKLVTALPRSPSFACTLSTTFSTPSVLARSRAKLFLWIRNTFIFIHPHSWLYIGFSVLLCVAAAAIFEHLGSRLRRFDSSNLKQGPR